MSYPDNTSAHVKDESFYYGEQRICSVETLKLKGLHNQNNACAAIDAAWLYTHDLRAIEEGLASFAGLPHRLQFVRELNSVNYYDDSIATTPSAAIAALRSFDGHKVIILGGSSKNSDFTELGLELTRHDVDAILIGDEATKIAASCDKFGFTKYKIVDQPTVDRVVELAVELSKPGTTVLLSPASASFGLFKNYADRGDQFSRAVLAL